MNIITAPLSYCKHRRKKITKPGAPHRFLTQLQLKISAFSVCESYRSALSFLFPTTQQGKTALKQLFLHLSAGGNNTRQRHACARHSLGLVLQFLALITNFNDKHPAFGFLSHVIPQAWRARMKRHGLTYRAIGRILDLHHSTVSQALEILENIGLINEDWQLKPLAFELLGIRHYRQSQWFKQVADTVAQMHQQFNQTIPPNYDNCSESYHPDGTPRASREDLSEGVRQLRDALLNTS